MEGVNQYIQNERQRLKRINCDKVYCRHLMDSPEICITFNDEDYKQDLESDYDFFIYELTKRDVEPSIVPVKVWVNSDSQKWGGQEISLY